MSNSTHLPDWAVKIKQRADKATKGPWVAQPTFRFAVNAQGNNGDNKHVAMVNYDSEGIEQCEANGYFVTYSREDIPKLLDALEKAMRELVDVRDSWDCDEDGHKYNTGCRKCDADNLLKELQEM